MMVEIQVSEVKSAGDLDDFIRFPMTLYHKNPYYVPPLISEEKKIWKPEENPALAYSVAKQFLAKKNGKIVGRIAVMINGKEEEELGIRKVRFGWLDFEDDTAVSKLLLQKAIDFAKENGITKLEGPMGFTNLDKAGMLTMGFDKIATMIGLYNYPYYAEHLEGFGFVKEKEWVEFEMQFPTVLPEKIRKFSRLISEKYGLRVLRFQNKKEILPLVEPMFKLIDATYSSLSTYTPLTDEQMRAYREKYFPFIDKEYIICIVDQNHDLVSFAVTMPSYSKALQKANGKLLPFGWWHFLRATKKNDRANFYLIGIHPTYQRRGVTAIIFEEIFDRFSKLGIKYAETNPELEENKNVQLLWQDYNPINHKRRRTYALDLRQGGLNI